MHFNPGWLLKPVHYVRRKARKHYVSKERLLREGARVVTPAIETAQSFDPMAVSLGASQEAIIERMRDVEDTWKQRRSDLLTYLNGHPSEEIRAQGHSAIEAVTKASTAARWLFYSQRQPNSAEAYNQSRECHAEATKAMNDLMDAIRKY